MPRVSISTRHAPIRAVAARAAASSAAQVCASWSGLCCHSGVVDASVLVMRPAYRRMRTYDLGYSGVDQQRSVAEAGPAHDSAILVGDHPQCPQWTNQACGEPGGRVSSSVGYRPGMNHRDDRVRPGKILRKGAGRVLRKLAAKVDDSYADQVKRMTEELRVEVARQGDRILDRVVEFEIRSRRDIVFAGDQDAALESNVFAREHLV